MALPRSLASSLFGRQSRLVSTLSPGNGSPALLNGNPFVREFSAESGEETFTIEVCPGRPKRTAQFLPSIFICHVRRHTRTYSPRETHQCYTKVFTTDYNQYRMLPDLSWCKLDVLGLKNNIANRYKRPFLWRCSVRSLLWTGFASASQVVAALLSLLPACKHLETQLWL